MTERHNKDLLEALRKEYEQTSAKDILGEAIMAFMESRARDGKDWPEWVDRAIGEDLYVGNMRMFKAAFEDGGDYALLLAVKQCAHAGKLMPE